MVSARIFFSAACQTEDPRGSSRSRTPRPRPWA